MLWWYLLWLDLPPCVSWQWALWLLPNHTPGALVCFCRARSNPCPDLLSALVCREQGQGICAFGMGRAARRKATSTRLSLSLLLASQRVHTPREYSWGFSSPSVCLSGFPSRQGDLSPPHGNPGWDAPIVARLAHSPGQVCTCVDLLFLTDPFQRCRSWPDAFVFHPSGLHGNLSYSFGGLGVLLPVSS